MSLLEYFSWKKTISATKEILNEQPHPGKRNSTQKSQQPMKSQQLYRQPAKKEETS